MRGVAVLALGLWASGARASDGAVRWHMEATVALPIAITAMAHRNAEARMGGVQVRLVTTCVPSDERREVCTIDDVAIGGTPNPADGGKLGPILHEYDQALTGATVDLGWTDDGRLKFFDLPGVPETSPRERAIHSDLRLLILRAYAGLEHAPVRGGPIPLTWKQPGPRIVEFPSGLKAMVGGGLEHQASRDADGSIIVTSKGRVTTLLVDADVIFKGRAGGDARYGGTPPGLQQRTWWSSQRATVSTTLSNALVNRTGDGTLAVAYMQGGHIRRLGPDEAAPDLGPTGEDQYVNGPSQVVLERLRAGEIDLGDDDGEGATAVVIASGAGVLRGNHAPTPGLDLRVGLRHASGVRYGVGIRADLPAAMDADTVHVDASLGRQGALIWVAWQGPSDTAPQVGVMGEIGRRSYDTADPGTFWMTTLAPEVGVLRVLNERWRVGLVARVEVDLRTIEVGSTGKGSTVLPRIAGVVGISGEWRAP